jgi:hypothetical protein
MKRRLLLAMILSGCATARPAGSGAARELEDARQELRSQERELEGTLAGARLVDCAQAGKLADNICGLADRICRIAAKVPEEAGAEGACADARGRCEKARARVAASCRRGS